MDATTIKTEAKKRLGKYWWLLVALAAVALWWHFRRPAEDTTSSDVADWSQADPDDILVDFRDGTGVSTVEAIERDLGIDLVLVSDQSADEAFFRAHVPADRRDAILATLGVRADVEVAEPDMVMSLVHETGSAHDHPAAVRPLGEVAVEGQTVAPNHAGYPNDPLWSLQWHMRQIGMPEAWKLADGGGITVAVLDTGVGYENNAAFQLLPDLAGLTFVDPYDFVDNDRHANDDHGHGSHVTGTIAQVTNNGIGVTGIARNVKIMPLKVLSGSGSGSVAGIADAIRYAADKGAKVINMSLGGPMPSRVLKNAVAYAYSKGVIVVCAAGNDGRGKVGYPAAYPGAFTVAATQFDRTTTFYSNWGKEVDIAAPGGNTRVDQNGDGMPDGVYQNTIAIGDPTKNDYFGYMGTSMAAPHVAGVAALVIGEGVTEVAAVERILKDSATKPESGYVRDRYGAGIVDAHAAVLAARSGHGGLQLGFGLLLAGAVAASVRKRGVGLGLGYLGGVMVGASGLFFLPYLAGGLSSWPVIEMLTRGLPSWDLALFGPLGHGNAVFFSAALPLGLLAVGYGVPRLRAPLAGVAVGVAAHLAFQAIARTTDIQYIPGAGFDAVWLLANATVSVLLARLALRR